MRYLKNLVFRLSLLAILVCLIALSVPFSGAAQNSETPVFDRIKQVFEEGQIFTADFSHEYKDSFTGERQLTEGTIWIGKEMYKIEGSNQRMMVDGQTSTVFDGSRNRVIVSDYIEEEDDFAPSRMLQGVDDSYAVTEEPAENGETRIRLVSDDPFSVFMEVFIYADENGHPLRIEAIDQVENELITRFGSGEFMTGDPQEIFMLEIPADAEQIDLRQETR